MENLLSYHVREDNILPTAITTEEDDMRLAHEDLVNDTEKSRLFQINTTHIEEYFEELTVEHQKACHDFGTQMIKINNWELHIKHELIPKLFHKKAKLLAENDDNLPNAIKDQIMDDLQIKIFEERNRLDTSKVLLNHDPEDSKRQCLRWANHVLNSKFGSYKQLYEHMLPSRKRCLEYFLSQYKIFITVTVIKNLELLKARQRREYKKTENMLLGRPANPGKRARKK